MMQHSIDSRSTFVDRKLGEGHCVDGWDASTCASGDALTCLGWPRIHRPGTSKNIVLLSGRCLHSCSRSIGLDSFSLDQSASMRTRSSVVFIWH